MCNFEPCHEKICLRVSTIADTNLERSHRIQTWSAATEVDGLLDICSEIKPEGHGADKLLRQKAGLLMMGLILF